MGERFLWYREPIVIVPLMAAALGLIFVPFFVWGAATAPQFYGSLFAALIAALAVVGNARLTKSENIRKEQDEAMRLAKVDSLRLLGFTKHLSNILQIFSKLARSPINFNLAAGVPPSPNDKSNFEMGHFRSVLPADEMKRLETALGWAATLPGSVSSYTASTLYMTLHAWDASLRMEPLADSFKPARQTLDGAATLAESLDARLIKNIAKIEEHMKAQGHLT